VDRQIRQLAIGLLVLFLLLFGAVNYVQVFAADRIANDPANAYRQLLAEYRVDRGKILARDNTVLALSRKSRGPLEYRRQYPDGPTYAGITGFYSLFFGRTELEQSFNPFLAGSAPELLRQTLTDLVLNCPTGTHVVSAGYSGSSNRWGWRTRSTCPPSGSPGVSSSGWPSRERS
jgi:peptidoglycan glycosyltransferase